MEIERNIRNMYGTIMKYKEYVWKYKGRFGICMEIYRNILNMYGNIRRYTDYVWKYKAI